MAELNLNQITNKLNDEFSGDTRKLIFWYDDIAEFDNDIETLHLANAKIYHLETNNQFYTKYFLERQDKHNNYLIYAPFPKPQVRDNHLEDMLLYSKQFFADRASLLAADLGIHAKYKPIIQKYIKFFGAKERTQRFYDLEIENFTRESIEVALMSVICKTRTSSFEEVLRVILTDDGFEDNRFLAEFDKFDLLPAIWRLCEEQFGYTDVKPSLEKLMFTLFITYTERYLHSELPTAWRSFVSYKSGNIIAFMDNLMNNILYRDRYDEISRQIASSLNVASVIVKYKTDALLYCDTFSVIDSLILKWIKDRLLAEDIGAMLGDLNIPAVCQVRLKKHFGAHFQKQYLLVEHAFHLISQTKYTCPDGLKAIVHQYRNSDAIIDTHYRKFYFYFDQLSETSSFEELRDLVENIYANEYLSKLLTRWSKALASDDFSAALPLQRDFFNKYIKYKKDRVVVIISDAMRYEVGLSLFEKLRDNEKSTVSLEPMLSVLPSYTRLGMAALLPHKVLEMTDDYKILIDGASCDDLKQRESILNSHNGNSRCIQFDDIKSMKRDELRDIFTGMDVVYVYHNQIDARGDKANTENEVFSACEEAIEEIYGLIQRLSVSANTYHFIVTADHGFLYKRDKLQESDKIINSADKWALINRRFIVAQSAIEDDGIAAVSLGRILNNADTKIVSFPISTNVFKIPGGGQNYVHGGCSPQEMLIPMIDIRMERYHMETRPAQIALVSMIQKITNLIASLDFIQSEPVSDLVKATNYKLFFVSEDNEKISNECIYVADKKDIDPQKRIFRLRFNFKNKQYDKSKKYFLVAYDDKNDLEVLRHDVIMDIVFSNDFGFNV